MVHGRRRSRADDDVFLLVADAQALFRFIFAGLAV